MRLAIFGGTFNPIHSAHLRIASEAADRYALDRVLLIPAAHPPHKPAAGIVPYEHRLAMVQLAAAADPRFVASDLESGQEKSYSIRTIEKVRSEFDGPLFFIIGADAFEEIATWYRWRDVIAQVEFIVVTRPGHHYRTPEGAAVHALDGLELPVSSSDIRKALARGQRPKELPDAVYDYIRRHGLYQM